MLIYVLLAFVTGPGIVHADQELNPDKFRFTLGAYSVFNYQSRVSLSNTDRGVGVFIEPQETLGLDSEQTVGRLTGYYRFDKNHALDFAWYRISTNASKILEKDLEWTDEDGKISLPLPVFSLRFHSRSHAVRPANGFEERGRHQRALEGEVWSKLGLK